MVKIYGLVCPISSEIRYIGKTSKDIHKRLRGHIADAKTSSYSHKRRWIRKLLSLGLQPTPWLLEEVPENQRWQDRERAWIAKAYAIGLDLTNQTAGGEGLDWVDDEDAAAYRKNLSESLKAVHKANPNLIAIAQEGNKRSWRDNRDGRIAAIAESSNRPESKRKHKEAMAKARSRPEFRVAKSKGAKQAWANHRETMMAAFAKPEVKAKHSARAKRCWADDETRARMMNRWTTEARAKQAAAIKERSAKIQAAMTPEVRAKQAAKLRETWAKRKQNSLK